MKKYIFPLAFITLFAVSCSNVGNKAETKDAVAVTEVEKTSENTFSAVSAQSHITWRGTHLGGVQPRFGKVLLKNADISIAGKTVQSAKITIDMPTITVENFSEEEAEMKNKLTGHLASGDFFKTETYPTSTFELTGIEATQGEYNSKVTGNLTILDKTKNITFNANITVSDSGVKVKSENFAVDRRDWGITYNVEGTEGVPVDYLIANDVGFSIDVEVTK